MAIIAGHVGIVIGQHDLWEPFGFCRVFFVAVLAKRFYVQSCRFFLTVSGDVFRQWTVTGFAADFHVLAGVSLFGLWVMADEAIRLAGE